LIEKSKGADMDSGKTNYERYLAGDDGGLVEIIKEYGTGLTFYLRGYSNDMSEAEELTEDTFVSLAIKKPKFKSKSSFKTFLYTIGRNLALDRYRKSKNRVLPLDEKLDYDVQTDDSEKKYIKSEINAYLYKCLANLPLEYRQVIWLVYFEELNYREVGKIVKKSEHAVANTAYKARKLLKIDLEKEGFQYDKL